MAKRKFFDDKPIIYEKHFQNTHKAYDLVVYATDKTKTSNQEKTEEKFVRNCVIAETLRKGVIADAKEKENCVKHKPKAMKQKSKKKVKDKPDITWKELLDQNSSLGKSSLANTKNNVRSESSTNESCGSAEFAKRLLAKSNVKRNKAFPSVPIQNDCANDANRIGESTRETEYRNINRLKVNKITSQNEKKSYKADLDNLELKQNTPTNDDTYSPFGHSALQILHHLRLRLRSRGDSEGSEMISVLETIINGKASAKNMAGAERTPSESNNGGYPPVFFTPHLNDQLEENRKLKMELEKLTLKMTEQEQKIKNQTKLIEDLQEVTNKVLEFHEQENESKTNSKADVESEETIDRLTSENEKLKIELKNNIDVIINLEIKLAKANRQLEDSKQSSIPSCNVVDDVKGIKNTHKDTDQDSAFDDKSASVSTSRSISAASVAVKEVSPSYNDFFAPNIEEVLLPSGDSSGECVSQNLSFNSISKLVSRNLLPPEKVLKSVHEENCSSGIEVEPLNETEFEVPSNPVLFNVSVTQRGQSRPNSYLESTRLTKDTSLFSLVSSKVSVVEDTDVASDMQLVSIL